MYTQPITSPVAGSTTVYVKPLLFSKSSVPLQIAEVVQHAAVVWPGARFPARRLVDVLHRRRPRLIVGVVVLRTEWFEAELLRRESERDDESGRDKRRLAHSHIFVDPAATYQKNQNWDTMELYPRLRERLYA